MFIALSETELYCPVQPDSRAQVRPPAPSRNLPLAGRVHHPRRCRSLRASLALNAHEDEIDEIVGEWNARHTLEELEAVLDKAAVPAARIYAMEDFFRDPHYAPCSAIVCTMYRSN